MVPIEIVSSNGWRVVLRSNMQIYFYIGIATFGATYLLRYLDGPFDILKKFRQLTGIKYIPVINSDEEIEEIPDTVIAKLVGCFWCLSTWVSIFLCVIHAILNAVPIFDAFTGIFICTGIAGFMNSILSSMEK